MRFCRKSEAEEKLDPMFERVRPCQKSHVKQTYADAYTLSIDARHTRKCTNVRKHEDLYVNKRLSS